MYHIQTERALYTDCLLVFGQNIFHAWPLAQCVPSWDHSAYVTVTVEFDVAHF